MADYHATWEIDIEAESAEEAARFAQKAQRRLDTTADVFKVYEADNGECETFDLLEIDEEQGRRGPPLTAPLRDWRFGSADYEAGTPPSLKGEWLHRWSLR